MGVSRYLPRRSAALALSVGVALATLGPVGPVQATAPIADPAGAAVGWLATQVEAGNLAAGDLAATILAFAGTHKGASAAADAMTKLKPLANVYMGYGGTLKPGRLALVMLAVIASGGDATSFNSHNLDADLRGLEVASGPDAGMFSGASVDGQAWAILALKATPGGIPAGAADWLAGKQCTAGDFQYDGSCPSAAGGEDPDTTAIALQALLAAGSTTAADKAAAWLAGYQAPSGAFSAYGSANANSTGAAAQALRAAGNSASAGAAADFVASLQDGCSAAAVDRGAINYTSTSPGYPTGPGVPAAFSSTVQGVLAFGAARMDKLTLTDAAAGAPTLTCAVATPKPSSSGVTVPTEPPTDALVPASPISTSGDALLLMALLTLIGGTLALGRRPGRRR